MARKPVKPKWSLKRHRRNSFEIRIPYTRDGNWEQWVLATGDRHWDNPHSDQEMQKRHLDEARECNAPVIDIGDWFCAMQGKYDKRSSKHDVRPEHQVDHYLDALVETAVEFFKPYASILTVIGSGNHEQSIKLRHETDLLERFTSRLRNETGEAVYHGGYGGFVRFRFHNKGQAIRTINLHYSHGYGGGGPVTKSLIQNNRRTVYLPDAHIVLNGHIHSNTQDEYRRIRLRSNGAIEQDSQLHISVPTYKDDFRKGDSGWHVRRGGPPKPIGAMWIRFFRQGDQILFDTRKAQ